MRLPRTDLVPVLAIIAGGAIGVLGFSTLILLSPSNDVPAPDPVVAPSATAEFRRFLEQREIEAAPARLEEAQRLLERPHRQPPIGPLLLGW